MLFSPEPAQLEMLVARLQPPLTARQQRQCATALSYTRAALPAEMLAYCPDDDELEQLEAEDYLFDEPAAAFGHLM